VGSVISVVCVFVFVYRQRHPNLLSRFVTVHFPDRQSNRQTDRHTDWQMG